METTKKEKTFDAVKMMREIRDKISSETQNMTFEELKVFIKNNSLTAKQNSLDSDIKRCMPNTHKTVFFIRLLSLV